MKKHKPHNQNHQDPASTINWSKIFDSLNDPMMILDLDNRIINCNQAMATLTGNSVGDLLGKSCCSVAHDDKQPPGNCPLRAVRLTKTRQTAHQYVNGRWFNVVVDPISDTAGQLSGVVHAMQDVTAQQILRTKDVLTNLFNRSYFEAGLGKLRPGQACGIILCDIDGLAMINDSLGFVQGNKLLVDVAALLLNAFGSETVVARTGEDAFGILLPDSSREEIDAYCKTIRSEVNGFNIAKGRDLLSLSIGSTHTEAFASSPQALFALAHDSILRQKLLSVRSVRSATALTVKRLLEARDINTGQHSERSQDLITRLAVNIGLPESSIDNLRLLGRFHDIGKIGVSDTILLKPDRLTAEEFQSMTKHCEIGYYIAMSLPDVSHIADWILKHHERWDGKGYPLKLKGDEIPIECRAMAIVDAYDAIVSDRPYRKALPQEQAIAELQLCAGTQFDPDLTREFLRLLQSIPPQAPDPHNGNLTQIADWPSRKHLKKIFGPPSCDH
jgi:diguanylate cyclase (GGDEF)-like protein/PAS domain S-box-containing protein